MDKKLMFLCAVPVAVALFVVWDWHCTSRTVIRQMITDAPGSNSLVLVNQDISTIGDFVQGVVAQDFHSLIWQIYTNGRWQDRVIISKQAFQGMSLRTRWVSAIASVDGQKGTAIVKVAEGNAPPGARTIDFVYSWREWDLLANRETHFFRVCKYPFENF